MKGRMAMVIHIPPAPESLGCFKMLSPEPRPLHCRHLHLFEHPHVILCTRTFADPRFGKSHRWLIQWFSAKGDFAPQRPLTKSGDIFGYHSWRVFQASNRQRPDTSLYPTKYTGQPPPLGRDCIQRIMQPQCQGGLR